MILYATCVNCGRYTRQHWRVTRQGDTAWVECETCNTMLVMEDGIVAYPVRLRGRRDPGRTLTAVLTAVRENAENERRERAAMADGVLDLALADRKAAEARIEELKQQIQEEEQRLSEADAFVAAYRSYEARLSNTFTPNSEPEPPTAW